MRIVVDTDIIIDVLRNFKPTKEKLKKLVKGNELYISGITEAEVCAGKDMEVESVKKNVLNFLSKFKKVNPSNEIFQKAGEMRRKYKISLLDSIIAATAYYLNAKVFTRNVKDFKKIKEIKTLT